MASDPESNVDLIRRGYEAWNRRDVDAVLGFLDPGIAWRGYVHLPESGELRGHDEVRIWLERFLEAWDELEIELVDLLESGDEVVALVGFSGRGKGSGVEVVGGIDAHVWTMRGGKAVAVRLYQGTGEALRDTGLEGAAAGRTGRYRP